MKQAIQEYIVEYLNIRRVADESNDLVDVSSRVVVPQAVHLAVHFRLVTEVLAPLGH